MRFLPLLAMLAVSACRPAAAPIPAPPATLPVASPPAPAVRRITLPDRAPEMVYLVEQDATIRQDSAGRVQRDTLVQRSSLTVAITRDDRGQPVARATVRTVVTEASGPLRHPASPAGPGAPTPARRDGTTAPSWLPGPVTVQLALRGDATAPSTLGERVPGSPPPCDETQEGASAIVHDLLVRVPPGIAPGDRWTDTVVTQPCRAGVPLTITRVVTSTAERIADDAAGAPRLVVRQVLGIAVTGERQTPWQLVRILGGGEGRRTATFDLANGALIQLEGESTLRLRVGDGVRADALKLRDVTQASRVRVRAVRDVSP